MEQGTPDERDGSTASTAAAGYGEMAPLVMRFFERLRQLPAGAWMLASLPDPRPGAGSLTAGSPGERAARERLRRVVDGYPKAATRARAQVRRIIAGTQGGASRSELAAMTEAAVFAVLALAARRELSEEDFRWLYGPFVSLAPLEELGA